MNTNWVKFAATIAFAALQSISIFVPSAAYAIGPISSGETVTGAVLPANVPDPWTFSANSGDAIVVRVGEITTPLTGFSPRIRLFDPSNVLLGTASSTIGAEIAVTAAATGTFRVEVDDAAGVVVGGSYRLTAAISGKTVVVTAGDEGGAMTNGAMHTGTIAGGDLDVWMVSATAGDAIIVRMAETVGGSTLLPWLRIYSPAGGAALAQSFSAVGAEVAIIAPVTGLYIVVAGDGNATFNGTGTYRINLAQTGVAVTVSGGDQGGPLTNGVLHTGTIDVGDLDVWTVSATAGEAIVVRMGESVAGSTLLPWLRIFSPNGGAVLAQSFSAVGAEVAITAPVTGTYLVVATDGNSIFNGSGDYLLTLAKTGTAVSVSAGDEGGPLVNGAVQTGNIVPGDLDVYTVSATAGDTIIVRMAEDVAGSTLLPWLRIYGPNGGVALAQSFSAVGAEVQITAPTTGTYLVVAGDGNSTFNGSGSYLIELAQSGTPVTVSPGDEGGALVNGAMQTGTLGLGDIDLWTVTATAGDRIIVRMGEMVPGSTLLPWLRIFSPTGAQLDASFSAVGAEVDIAAPVSGTYLVVAADGNSTFNGSGTYRITLAKTGSPVTVSPGDQGGPMINGIMHTGTLDVGDLDVWTVSATAGQRIVVRIGETVAGSTLLPWIRIFSPAGAQLDESFSAAGAEVEINAPVTGIYLVVVGDGNSTFNGSGDYQMTLAQSGTPVFVSAGDEGGVLTNGAHTGSLPVGDLDVYEIGVNAGDALTITMTEQVAGSTLLPWLRLINPSGTQVGTSFAAGQAQINHMATATGTYLLIAADGNSIFNGSGGYTLNLSGATGTVVGPPPTLNVDASTLTKYDALTDGLLVLRYLFGLTGPSLTTNAIGVTATRTTPAAIAGYLDSIRPALDIDNNGEADALTDGLLIIRFLFGLRGNTLIVNAVDPLGNRKTVTDIEDYILSLMP